MMEIIKINGYEIVFTPNYLKVNKGWCNWLVYPHLTYMTITGSKETIDDSVWRYIKIFMEENSV